MDASDKIHRLLISSLFLHYNMGAADERCAKFLRRSDSAFRHLLDGIVINDEVVVPTQDFMVLPVMVRRLGGTPLMELLDSGCFRFVRFPAAIGYAGNGRGLIAFGIQYPDGRKRPIVASVADSARAALSSVGMYADRTLIAAIEKITTEVNVQSDFGDLENETYRDVINSCELRGLFAVRGRNLKALPGIAANETRIYGGPDEIRAGDEVDVLLTLVTANLELMMANVYRCDNSATSGPIDQLLKAKISRLAQSEAGTFTTLRELANIPDVGFGILNGDLKLAELLRLRESNCARQFRDWFNNHKDDEPIELAKAYIDLLNEVPAVQSLPMRIIRYLVTTALGLVPFAGALAGPAASALDSFLVDRLFGENPSAFFVDQLKRLGEH